MEKLLLSEIKVYYQDLMNIPDEKLLITTLNAHCYNLAQTDKEYFKALFYSDVILPDGVSIVLAYWFLKGLKIKKIAGADLFFYEMNRLNNINGKCFFLGSSESTLELIVNRAKNEFPKVQINTYSPPYKKSFSHNEDVDMIKAVNTINPDVLFIGMTAPKQEKWAYKHFKELKTKHICCIGAVFDFYAGTVNRAPGWMIKAGFEWLYRLLKEPGRLWKRYLIGNVKFFFYLIREKINFSKHES